MGATVRVAGVRPRRRDDWPESLEALIRERECVPFAWGSNDCALFAADAVLAMTGHDCAADARGTYTGEQGAARKLTARGGLSRIVERYFAEVGVAFAGRGDIVLFDGGRGEMLGVCTGTHFVAPAPTGLLAFPLRLARRAWRV